MIKDYKQFIPKIFHDVDYLRDVPEDIRIALETSMRSGKGLYLYGPPGVGKTHMVCAILRKMTELPVRVLFHNANDFLEEIKKEFENGIDYEARDVGVFEEAKKLKGILFLDDLGVEKSTEWSRERFCSLINHRYEEMLPTIFTSNCDLDILSARMGQRVVSRIIGMSTVLEIGGQDRRITTKA
jgi:DNA replication protein DnaC